MSNTATTKRKYTKTPRWTISVNGETVEASGLVEVLKRANAALRDGSAETVTIARIKKDSTYDAQ